jgi:hypothetical protein
MAPDFDSLIAKVDDSLRIAVSMADDNDDALEAVRHLSEAVTDLKAAVLTLAEHTSMPREVKL